MKSHFSIEGARRRLGEATIDVRWAREKNGAFPSIEAKAEVEKAVAAWQRAHTTLKNAAETFGTRADREAAALETLPE
jgi:hypothetical protein